jgi:DNA (cytosine-5)-methyltransferase 1
LSDFKFIDLFAGIGGIRKGFEANGGECIFTSEWDSYSQKTYAANFQDDHQLVGDINDVMDDIGNKIPAHDVLLAGFPCQPFSIAGVSKKNSLGRAHGFACQEQGNLFFKIADILAIHRPHAFLLENVKNLKSHDKGKTFRIIMETLQDVLKYKVAPMVVDAKGFVPQHRERVYIVGFRDETAFTWADFVHPDSDRTKLTDILHREDGTEKVVDGEQYILAPKGSVNPKYTLTNNMWKYLVGYAAKHKAAGNGFGFGLVGPNETARTLSARYYKDGSEILISQGDKKNPRRLTPRECARLMGFTEKYFPTGFKIPVSDTRAYKQFGNAVAIPVIDEIARIMRPHIIKSMKTETGTGNIATNG